MERVKGFEPSTSTLAKQPPTADRSGTFGSQPEVFIGGKGEGERTVGNAAEVSRANRGSESGSNAKIVSISTAATKRGYDVPDEQSDPPKITPPVPQKPQFPPDLQARLDALAKAWPTMSDKERRGLDGLIDFTPPPFKS